MATSAGLVSVTTGSLVVSGTLTSFVAAEGDQFVARGITAIITRAISPSQLQLKQPWPGPDITGAADWDISLTGPYWQSSVVTNRRLSDLLNAFEAGPVKWDAQGPPSDRAKYNDQGVGFVFLSVGDPWTLFVKLANTGQTSDWSPGQAIRGSPAESTVEAQAARDDALLSANAADGSAGSAAAAASTASGAAGAAAGSAGSASSSASTASTAAGTATAQAATAAAQATQAAIQASTAASLAATASLRADAALAARQAAEEARDQTLPAVSQAQAAASATAQDRAQTGNDRSASGAAVAQTQAARDAAVTSAADARSYAAILQSAVFDWSFDSSPDSSNDWSA